MSQKQPALSVAILFILAFIWGSSFILMKEGLKSFSSFQVAAYRLSIAGVFFLPVFLNYISKVDKKDFGILFLSGLTGSGIPAFLFTYAQLHINSSTAGALNALTPFFALMIGVLFLGMKLQVNKALGVFIGLLGALLIIIFKPGGGRVETEVHGFLIMLATFLYGINVNLIKQRLSHYNPWIVAALPIVFMLPVSGSILYFSGFFSDVHLLQPQDLKSVGAISILGLFGTAISLVMFNRLIQMTNAVFASSVTYLIPVFALIWGLLDHEKTGPVQIAGLFLILIGIAVIRRSDRTKIL